MAIFEFFMPARHRFFVILHEVSQKIGSKTSQSGQDHGETATFEGVNEL
jgi:hypothetical protein